MDSHERALADAFDGQAARFERAPVQTDPAALSRLVAFAGLKPGSRVLDGRWGLESFAIGIPKGREAAMPLVRAFVSDAKTNGAVARAVERAGLQRAALSD